MSKRRKKAAPALEEHHVDERWMASYMDMVTVLMCMFIVLFAMSTVDQDKYEKLKSSLATGFGTEVSENIDVTDGLVVPPENVGEDGEMLTDMQAAITEVDDLTKLEEEVRSAMAAQGLQDAVRFSIDERGLTVRMVSSDMFFAPDSPVLQDQARRVLNTAAPAIKASSRSIDVEGHTAQQPGDAPLADWELSTDRAVNVVRHLTGVNQLDPGLIHATGYAGHRPLRDGYTPADMELNRRVDVVVLSDKPESVRALIPSVVDGTAEKEPAKQDKPAEESGH